MAGGIIVNDGKPRCGWCNMANPLYVRYHDTEWGRPVRADDRLMFEMLLLEMFQAGLSWECVLNKREALRRAFDGFDCHKVAAYGPEKIQTLCADASIIRNRLKIKAAVTNAQVFLLLQREYGSSTATFGISQVAVWCLRRVKARRRCPMPCQPI